MMKLIKNSRANAVLIHFLGSCLLACLTLVVVFNVWYPSPWADTLDIGKILLITLIVDLCLGPLLTLIIYKHGKRSLRFDLTVIVCLRLIALSYGVNTIAAGRPTFLVFSKNRFDLVLANEIYEQQGEGKTIQMFVQNAWKQPLLGVQLVAAQMPNDAHLMSKLSISALSGGPDVQNILNYHRPYASLLQTIQTTAIKLASYTPVQEKNKQLVRTIQSKYPENSIVSPLKVKFEILTVVLNPNTGDILGIEPVDIFE